MGPGLLQKLCPFILVEGDLLPMSILYISILTTLNIPPEIAVKKKNWRYVGF